MMPRATARAIALALLAALALPAHAAKPAQPERVLSEDDPSPDPAVRKQLALRAQAQGKYKMAWELLLPMAEAGDADAAYQMGWLTETGWEGFTGDSERAVAWYRRAAERGHTLAQLWLGYHYAGSMAMDNKGTMDAAGVNEGVAWLEKAADSGNEEAQLMLGDIYGSGRGPILKDRTVSRYWLGRAAAQGNALAQIMLRSR